MLALCLWIQSTGIGTVQAFVTYNNGTVNVTEQSTSEPFTSTSGRSCTVISQHIASGAAVAYSATVSSSGGGAGTYGLDIVETQVQ